MKNHELLDLIGEVNEDYVQAADGKVIRPRFRWKTAAACAACAVLMLGAYPAYQAAHPALHGYTVMEGGGMTTLDDVKAPAGGGIDVPGRGAPGDVGGDQPGPGQEDVYAPNPNTLPGGAYVGPDAAGKSTLTPGMDIPVDEAAADQYDRLLQGLGGVDGREPAAYPEWFAGAWIDHGGAPETPACLTVSIVDGFRTPELEAQVRDWCGGTGDVAIVDAKYSKNHLDGLMVSASKALDGTGLCCGIGVDVTANCLGVDLYGEAPTPEFEKALAELAKLDPDGDAIRVRLFTGKLDTLTDGLDKGPAPEPVAPDARATPTVTEDGQPVPGGKTVGAQEGGAQEATQPAACGLPEPTPVPAEDLPGYDILYGADE